MQNPPCLHCKTPSELTTGREVYPHRQDLHEKTIWICRECGAYCGCHPNTTASLGFPANKETRIARMKLHNMRLDPLWKKNRKTGEKGRYKRSEVYQFLQAEMKLTAEQCHTGQFTIEQCRKAWKILGQLTGQSDTPGPFGAIQYDL